jgi:HEPN pEK499 p136
MKSQSTVHIFCWIKGICRSAPTLLGVTNGVAMSFNSDFERAFIERSLVLVQQYKGPYDATLLLNCLLGLLVVPKESCLAAIPDTPTSQLLSWGIDPKAITSFGKWDGPNNDPNNLRGFIWRLRNAVAHFHFKPVPADGDVVAFNFKDQSGFEATVQIAELRVFVECLASHIKTL